MAVPWGGNLQNANVVERWLVGIELRVPPQRGQLGGADPIACIGPL